jgi:hypothetical protein
MRSRHAYRWRHLSSLSAQFEAPIGSEYEWMNRAMFVGKAEREPDMVTVHFFRVL